VKRIASLAAAALGLALLAGCSNGTGDLATVGSTAITRDDFDMAARQSGAPYAALGDTGRFLLLDDLIKRQLMVEAAQREGLYRDSSFVLLTSNVRNQELRVALLDVLTPSVPVSEAEARAFYDRQASEAHMRVILVTDRSQADLARAELEKGIDFALVAARFNTPGQVPAGGDIGWVQAGTLVRALDPAASDGPVGKVIGPVEQPYVGWFLVRIEERRKAERPPYDQVHDRMVEAVRQRKRSALAQRAAQKLSAEYRIQVAKEGAAFMSERLKSNTQDLQHSNTPPDPNLTEDERRTVLGTWSGGTYTLGDAWNAIQKHAEQGPNLYMLPQVERWIEGQMFERALVAEANQRMLADEPQHARAIRDKQNGYLVESYYNREVAQKTGVTEADLRAEYALRAAELQGLRSADIKMAVIPDSTKALAVLDHAAHGGGLERAVQMAQVQTQVSPYTVNYPTQSPVWQALQSRLLAMRPGETSGPFHVPGGWLVIELVRSQQGASGFENLDAATLEQIRSSALERMRETRFMVLTDSLRRSIPVVVHRDRLARIPWPPPSGAVPAVGSGG
jgi:peptidyl-prolyl cis-trans isomerase C